MPYVKETKETKFGDYQFDMSVLIARQVSTPEATVTPESVTKAVLENLETIDLIEKVCTAGAISFYLH